MEDETIQDAVVLAVEPHRLMVRIERNADDCGGCRACALKSLCHKDADRLNHLELAVPRDGGAPAPAPGDTVRVGYRAANPATAALVMFLPALAGLCFGGFAAMRLAGGGDGVFLVGCLAGLALGLGASFAAARRCGGLKPVVRLLPPA